MVSETRFLEIQFRQTSLSRLHEAVNGVGPPFGDFENSNLGRTDTAQEHVDTNRMNGKRVMRAPFPEKQSSRGEMQAVKGRLTGFQRLIKAGFWACFEEILSPEDQYVQLLQLPLKIS